eukprot:3726638-Ditylum_brightwellii.AAC.1
MFHQGSGHGFSSRGRIWQVCCPFNRQNVLLCQSDANQWTWYIMHNMQLFIWRAGRATYAFWSLAEFP